MAVLVTRPDEKGVALTEMLNKAGIAAIHLPFFTLTAGRELNQLPSQISQLKAGDYIFAVSPAAIRYAAESLQAVGFHWRKDLRYFAVGQSSAELFASQSEQAVIYPYGQENSEGLLKLPAMQDLTGKKVLILRGNGGRELFPTQAQALGAQVEILECYQRQAISYDNQLQTSICKRAGINQILVTSNEILTTLVNFVPEQERDWLFQCRLICVSQRIVKNAQQFGWQAQNLIIAPRADNQTLLQTVLSNNPNS